MKKKFIFIIVILLFLVCCFCYVNLKPHKSDPPKQNINKKENITKKENDSNSTSETKQESFSESELEEPAKDETTENQKENNEIDKGVTIELNGDEEMTVTIGSTFKDPGAKAKNSEGKDVSSKITIDGTVDTSKAGTYKIYYSIGKAIVVREVEVK